MTSKGTSKPSARPQRKQTTCFSMFPILFDLIIFYFKAIQSCRPVPSLRHAYVFTQDIPELKTQTYLFRRPCGPLVDGPPLQFEAPCTCSLLGYDWRRRTVTITTFIPGETTLKLPQASPHGATRRAERDQPVEHKELAPA